ncbi:FxLD family lanthipeptide [Streptomyces triticiradicis]|uniref:FxLD family lantipeptide n=1 Tax=Streptomyces triticiradicis TaxID=2651189 RepID=A0A7J5DM20_9ACTN|nr:FxLD family lanthipeptide [Streptomyces triticiradicis]KAB1989790.1 FxLD family lantipeptide [Streptomyces triticiradicis]
MSPQIQHSTKAQPTAATPDSFDLDVRLVDVADVAGLINLTDDNCGTTCGTCVSSMA